MNDLIDKILCDAWEKVLRSRAECCKLQGQLSKEANMALISRDSFARTELHKETVRPAKGESCKWCGRLSYNRGPRLFKYRRESDGGRVYEISGLFCSVECMRTYHGA